MKMLFCSEYTKLDVAEGGSGFVFECSFHGLKTQGKGAARSEAK